MQINHDSEDSFGLQARSVVMDYLDVNKLPGHQIYLQKQIKTSFYSLWEIQSTNPFEGGFITYQASFRLKNVSTGQYLLQDTISRENLSLTNDGNTEECFFTFRQKKIETCDNRLEYEDLIKIQTVKGEFLQSIDENLKERKIICGPKIADTSKLTFYLSQTDKNTSQIANRIASVFPFLMNFYIYLQNWGIVINKEYFTYDFHKAFATEKNLVIEVDELIESLENLNEFLHQEDSVLSLRDKQNILLEQKIVDMLILTAKLMDSKMFVHTDLRINEDHKNKRRLFKIMNTKLNEELLIYEKTPQSIARKYLRKPLQIIYKILFRCIKQNINASKLILKFDAFLSIQLIYFREEAGKLIKEAIRNATNLIDQDIGEEVILYLKYAIIDILLR